MIAFVAAVLSLLSSRLRRRAWLELEVFALHHQLAVLRRQCPGRLRPRSSDRLFWAWLYRLWPRCLEAMILVKPATVIHWHRRGFQLCWRWRSSLGRRGRPAVGHDVRASIRHMSQANPLWDAPRIDGELLKLGIRIGQTAVAKYMVKRSKSPSPSWRTVLQNQMCGIAALDMFVVVSGAFRLLYVVIVLGHARRQILHVAVTQHPIQDWLSRQTAPCSVVLRRRLSPIPDSPCPRQGLSARTPDPATQHRQSHRVPKGGRLAPSLRAPRRLTSRSGPEQRHARRSASDSAVSAAPKLAWHGGFATGRSSKSSLAVGQQPVNTLDSLQAARPQSIYPNLKFATGTRFKDKAGARSNAPRSPAGYLLTGLVFDDAGNRMSPSHVKNKDGRRYRYYITQALLQHRKDKAGSPPRIAAGAIEELVLDRIGRCIKVAAPCDVDTEALSETRSAARALIQRVEVGRDRVRLTLCKAASAVGAEDLRHRLPKIDEFTETVAAFDILIPIQLKTWGGEKTIEGPNGSPAAAIAHQDESLLRALGRAFEWRDALTSGATKSFRAIARSVGCTEGYVRQIIDLALLAPDIITTIMRGTHARHLTVDRLVRTPLPLSWSQQRRLFGLIGEPINQ